MLELRKNYTKVPRAEVIRFASGVLERPKSATLAVHRPSTFLMKILSDFKSLWMMGGFISWRNFMPLAVSKINFNRDGQSKGISLTFLWSKSNKEPYIILDKYSFAKLGEQKIILIEFRQSHQGNQKRVVFYLQIC